MGGFKVKGKGRTAEDGGPYREQYHPWEAKPCVGRDDSARPIQREGPLPYVPPMSNF